MSYCPKCGNKVEESMTFCPRCGASLKMAAAPPQAPPPTYRRDEKSEKNEKNEKNQRREPEKGEKQEKREHGHIGWLIAGVVVILFGVLAFLQISNDWLRSYGGPITLLVVGIVLVIVAVWYASMARKRNPVPPRP